MAEETNRPGWGPTRRSSQRRRAKAGRWGVLAGVGVTMAIAVPVLTAPPAGARACVLLCWAPPTTTTTTAGPDSTTTVGPTVTVPPVTIPPVVSPVPATEDPASARRLVELANAERSRAGLPAVAQRDDVVAIALAHSRRMAQAGDIFHNDAYFGSSVKAQLDAAARGENVAVAGSAEEIHARLMASSGHRANLLDNRFTVVGFAVVRDGGRYYATQDFIQPRKAGAVAPAAATTPGRAAAAPARARAAPGPSTTGPAAASEVDGDLKAGREHQAEVPPTTEGPSPPQPAPERPASIGPADTARGLAVRDAGVTSNPVSVGAGSLLLGVGTVLARTARRPVPVRCRR